MIIAGAGGDQGTKPSQAYVEVHNPALDDHAALEKKEDRDKDSHESSFAPTSAAGSGEMITAETSGGSNSDAEP